MSNKRRLKPNQSAKRKVRPVEQLQAFPGEIERYNGYECDTCHKIWITVDIHHGVTPMFTQCFGTEGCHGKGRSLMYPKGEVPAKYGPPIIEWFKPVKLGSYSVEMQEHILKGGLARRATQHTPEWVRRRL
jgi:hypothetical protein